MIRFKEILLNLVRFTWYRVIGSLFWMFPINKKRILLENFLGKGFGDNPRFIAEEFLRRNKNYELMWLCKGKGVFLLPEDVKIVKRGTLSELYYLATSKVWIDNCRKPYGIKKRKGQLYIQTWHGDIALKRIEREIVDKLPRYYLKSAINDSLMVDYFLSGSRWQTENIRKNFWYDGEILELGMPRQDMLFRYKKESGNIRNVVSAQIKYVLFAPTFRDFQSQREAIRFHKILDCIEANWGGQWKFMVRCHPNLMQEDFLNQCDDQVLNASNYPDMNDLILKSDLIITDYSSCMFDAMYAGKRVLVYMPDYEEYKKERGFSINIERLPFAVSYNQEELMNKIIIYDDTSYQQKVANFMQEFGIIQVDNAAVSVVNFIEGIISK